MKVKVGTVLDQDLLQRTRSVAAQEGKRLSQVIEEALSEHLKHKGEHRPASMVKRSRGCVPASTVVIDRVMREEPGILDR